jgi:hypothetical protein
LYDFHDDAKIVVAVVVNVHVGLLYFEQLELNDEYFLVVEGEVNEVKFVLFDHIVVMVVAKAMTHFYNDTKSISLRKKWNIY